MNIKEEDIIDMGQKFNRILTEMGYPQLVVKEVSFVENSGDHRICKDGSLAEVHRENGKITYICPEDP